MLCLKLAEKICILSFNIDLTYQTLAFSSVAIGLGLSSGETSFSVWLVDTYYFDVE